MTTPEYGAVRELWVRPQGHAGTYPDTTAGHDSFLIRDDVTNEQSATPGRTLRLGDAINTGPYSTWNQTSWAGGAGQVEWQDSQMFMTGTADTTAPEGRARSWPGWRSLFNNDNNPSQIAVTRMWSGSNSGGSPNQPLAFVGWSNGLWQRYDGYGNALTHQYTFANSVLAVCPDAEDNNFQLGTMLAIGLGDGTLWQYNANGNIYVQDTAIPANTSVRALASLNKTLYACIVETNVTSLYKRTVIAGVKTWTKVAGLTQINTIQDMIVWNGRLWILGVTPGDDTLVYSSDGASVVEGFWIHNFNGQRLQEHYGQLYIGGSTNTVLDDNATTQQRWARIYRYNGASLTKLHDATKGVVAGSGFGDLFGDFCSWGKYLAWTHNYSLMDQTDNKVDVAHTRYPGVTLYDAEADAIHAGPSLPTDPGGAATYLVYAQAVHPIGDSLMVAFYDSRDYSGLGGPIYPVSIARLRTFGYGRNIGFNYSTTFSFGKQQDSDIVQETFSSRYDASLPDEPKTFLVAVVRCRISVPGSISFSGTVDDGADVVGFSIPYDSGDTGWRTYRVGLLSAYSYEYVNGNSIAWNITTTDTETTNNSSHRIEVDSVSLQYTLSPQPRRTWRYRTYLGAGQGRLPRADGSVVANPLTTVAALKAKLYSYWSSGRPFYMKLEPSAAGVEAADPKPPGDDVLVMLTDYSYQSYRITDQGPGVEGEMSLTLTEVV